MIKNHKQIFSIRLQNKMIKDEAFRRCFNLRSVTIEEGVSSIWDKAFSECIRLTSIIIPNSVESVGSNVFDGCLSLQNVISVPDKLCI